MSGKVIPNSTSTKQKSMQSKSSKTFEAPTFGATLRLEVKFNAPKYSNGPPASPSDPPPVFFHFS